MNLPIISLPICVLALFCVSAEAIAKGPSETVLYSFDNNTGDGLDPTGTLVDVNGMLYGTTWEGGANSAGAVFAIDRWTRVETLLYSFGSYSGDGRSPTAGLTEVNGLLYGTTQLGGSSYMGAVFSIDPITGVEAVMHSFQNDGIDGTQPFSTLLNLNGTLYGTTQGGGKYGVGTVFSIDPVTGTETVVHSFKNNGKDGANPYAGLINVNGTLYGTTAGGGSSGCGGYGCGTVFSLNPVTSAEKVLYAFQDNGTDGMNPQACLVDVKGTLYGTTYFGGSYDAGTLFAVKRRGGAETVLHSFNDQSSDGFWPTAGLINVSDVLYGTTPWGGADGSGMVYMFDIATGTESTIYNFQTLPDAALPHANLIKLKDKLFGTSEAGGTYGYGTVFEIKP